MSKKDKVKDIQDQVVGVSRILNCEAPATLEEGSSKVLSSVEALGWSDVDMASGAILASKPTAMHPIPQIGIPRGAQDVGEPKLIPLSKPSDLKARILSMLPDAQSIHSLYGVVDDSTDEDFSKFCSDDSDDVDDFNQAMSSTPYYCDENGVTNFERDLEGDKQKAIDIQNAMAQMQNPLFQDFASLPDDVKATLLEQAKSTIDKASDIPQE